MDDFFKLKSSEEVINLYSNFSSLEPESINLGDALNRVLAEDIDSTELLPPFARSTMDGFAVRARDTFGCSESEPALLKIVGEIAMGSSGQDISLKPGQAARIWTGGELPQKADGVVMVEYTEPFDAETIAVYRPVAPGENVITAGEDYSPGKPVVKAGRLLRPQDLGVLSGLGVTELPVHRQPRVAILSTGDELVAASETPPPGKIRDINSTTIAALVREAGGVPIQYGICGDDFDELLRVCNLASETADMVLLSGGSSVGRRDFTLKVFEAMEQSELLVHGVSIRPGKPTILARQDNRALFGLPGHVASAMVVFYLFVRPLIRVFSGLDSTIGLKTIPATTTEQIPSAIGREDYIRVKLSSPGPDGIPQATPVYGRSGLLSPLVEADGLLPIGRDSEGLDKGAHAGVMLFP